jgi:hypothetical protein
MPWTNASIVLNSRDATSGQYNALKFNTNGQNIVQGQIHSISVNEVNFPYDVPNVQVGYNFFQIVNVAVPEDATLDIEVAPGYYTGTELATAVTAAIVAAGAANTPSIAAGSLPTVNYNPAGRPNSNTFSFAPPSAPGANYEAWFINSPWTYPFDYPPPSGLGKDLLSIMGFVQNRSAPALVESPSTFLYSGSAPLQFTQYVDICSPLLCQYQYFRDGSTTNLARRSDVICRLYISNNVATQEEEGTRPFVIQRQFNNARVMRWSAESSVGQIDLNLFDDCGQPLQTTWQPRPFQITFNCYEQDKDGTRY